MPTPVPVTPERFPSICEEAVARAQKRHACRGFTLVELTVVTVLGALLIGAILQVLITQQRTYTAQGAQIQGSQAIRAALDVLQSEIREISPINGDLVAMWPDSLRFRAMRAFGIICHDTVLGEETWRVLPFGQNFAASDSVIVFADNDPTSTTDDVWILTTVSSVTASTCGAQPAQLVTFASAVPFAADSVSSGAEVRAFTQIAYGLVDYEGTPYLGRAVSGGEWGPIAGPLATDGLTLEYLSSTGIITGVMADVAQVRVTLETGSTVLDSTGEPVSDSVTVTIYTRN